MCGFLGLYGVLCVCGGVWILEFYMGIMAVWGLGKCRVCRYMGYWGCMGFTELVECMGSWDFYESRVCGVHGNMGLCGALRMCGLFWVCGVLGALWGLM